MSETISCPHCHENSENCAHCGGKGRVPAPTASEAPPPAGPGQGADN